MPTPVYMNTRTEGETKDIISHQQNKSQVKY